MKRIIVLGVIIGLVGAGVFAYREFGRSPEVKRDQHLTKARAWLKEGKLSEAIIEYRNSVTADPRSAEARYEFAMVLLRGGNPKAAYSELVRAVDLKPDFQKARFELAAMHVLNRDIASAKKHLEFLRTQDRNSVETRHLAARIAVSEKQFDKALNELAELLKVQPNKASIYIEIGLIHQAANDHKSAEEAFRKALEKEPGYALARASLARLYVAAGNERKAEEELVIASKADPENEALLHLLGNFYSGAQRLNELEALYTDFLKKKPESLMAKKRLGELYLLRGDKGKVQQFADAILKAEPGDVDGLYFRGRLRLSDKNLQGALEDFTAVTKGATKFAPGYYYAGITLTYLNRTDDAKRNLDKAVELSPRWLRPREALARIYATRGDFDLASQQTETILKQSPANEGALLIAGSAQLRKGESEKALATFKKILAANPNSIPAHMNVAAVYTYQRKYREAVSEYETVLKRDPDVVDALASVIQLNVLQGNRNAAFERAERHLSKTKQPALVYQLMGQIRVGNKEYAEGVKYLEKAVEIDPNLASAYLLIGTAYAAEKKFDAAIENYEKIVQKHPKAVQALLTLGNLYDQKKQPQKANEYYQKVLDINSRSVAAANKLAWNYAQYGGNLDIALGLAQKAREANSNDPFVAQTLGWIYYKKGIYLSAIGLLKESNEKFKNSNPEVLYNLGMAYFKSGDKTLAAEHLRRSLRSGIGFSGREEATRVLEGLQEKQT